MDNQVYQIITDRIVKMLGDGTIPWRKPWVCKGGTGPANYVSDRPYHGINVLMLAWSAYPSRHWLTYKQALDAGGAVRKGEHGTPIIFWKFLTKNNAQPTPADDSKSRVIPMLRYYTVFNFEQCDNLPEKNHDKLTKIFDPIATAENILSGSRPHCPPITETAGADRACYYPSTDSITIPARVQFKNPAEFYSTAYHELVHATGHELRLNRLASDKGNRFGSADYSREELTAEMGAAMLCGMTGLDPATIDNSAAYISGWLQILKADNRAVIVAGGKAQKAVDYIVGEKSEEE